MTGSPASIFSADLPVEASAIDSVKDFAIARLNREGKVETWNQGAVAITQFPAEEMLGRPLSRLVETLDFSATEFTEMLATAAREGRAEDEGWRVRRDGSLFWVRGVLTALKNPSGEVEGFLWIGGDASAKKAESERSRARQAEIEAQLAERTRELAEARRSLLRTAKLSLLGELVAGIAHEINSPLTVISLKAQNLVEASRNPSPEMRDFLTVLGEMTRRIGGITRGLLAFVRPEEADPFANVAVQAIMENTLALCRTRFKMSGTQLLFQLPAAGTEFECRKIQVEQVLLNLLRNACEAAELSPDPWVELTVEADERMVRFVVADSGPGVSPEVRPRLMEAFVTGKAHSGGTGLGLSISRGIVEAHHGRLYLDPDSTRTRFVAEFPRRQPSSPAR